MANSFLLTNFAEIICAILFSERMKSFLLDMLHADNDKMAGMHERRVSNITIIRDGFFTGSVEVAYDQHNRMTRLTEMRSDGVAQRNELIYEGENVRISRYEKDAAAPSDQCEMVVTEGRIQQCNVTLNMLQQPVSEQLNVSYDESGRLKGFQVEGYYGGRKMTSEMRVYWQGDNLLKVENLIENTIFSKCEFTIGQTINPTGNILSTLLLADDLCDVFMNFGCAHLFGKGPRNMIKRCLMTKYAGGKAHVTTFEIAYHHDGYLKRIKKTEEGADPKREFTVLVFDWE